MRNHRRRVLADWVLAVVAVIGLAQAAGSRLNDNFALAGPANWWLPRAWARSGISPG
jgi:hypothetical protein